eukprot:TRINITY_DN389_c0_g1_i1.p1 TRINITY_DN389_c0_g1~~TRINITY_DN389_c0_g1_i1.p1  ORF type:complete len:325 (-),score=48.02 TRINITY_DN389_c0_g1_i1:160-1134(-)
MDSKPEDKPEPKTIVDALGPAYSRPYINTAIVRNKAKRARLRAQHAQEKETDRKQRRKKRRKMEEELGEQAPPKQIPKTLDNMREPDDTFVVEEDNEVFEDLETDEFADYFNRKTTPKLMITTNRGSSKKIAKEFIETQLLKLFPNSEYYPRRNYHVKEIIEYCKNRGFTDVIVVNEDRRKVNGLLLSHLPDGPTALFKVTTIIPMEKIPHRAGYCPSNPELILNNFDTRLGTTIGRMISSLFPQDPEFRHRRVVTFHNQRDYVFVRQHRYIFDSVQNVRLQEMGPRFTLKLRSLQHGTFDSKYGEFEWLPKKENITSRRRFFL